MKEGVEGEARGDKSIWIGEFNFQWVEGFVYLGTLANSNNDM